MNSGPPPDPMALRRDRPGDKDGWTTLPATGREGEPPAWPLAPFGDAEESELAEHVRLRESDVWAAIWSTPQAWAWERLGWTHDVALYVRLLVLGEGGSVRSLSEARQWSDRLGLNPTAMLRNRWRIGPAEEKQKAAAKRAPAKRRTSRDRFKVVPGGRAG